MGKLGKKARKFAKKNLQSVLRQKRKNKTLFKKKSSSKDEQSNVEDQVGTIEHSNRRSYDVEDIEYASLDAVFAEDDTDVVGDASDSDGYLSEDSSCPHVAKSEAEDMLEGSTLSTQNEKIQEHLSIQKKKLDRLRRKDPGFSKFLEKYSKSSEALQNHEMYSDEDDTNFHGMELLDDDSSAKDKGKIFTKSDITSWCLLIKEGENISALISLLNAFRAACHYGAESSIHTFQNSETFCHVLVFLLSEGDNIFHTLLKIPSSNCKKEAILELKSTSKWKDLRPLVKSYLRSSLFLLSQASNLDILAFCLTRVKDSLVFFAAFPSLLRRLIKTAVNLWTTGEGSLSSASFLIIRDAALVFSSEYFGTCMAKSILAYITQSRVSEIANVKRMQFLRDSLVELCSLDVQKSSAKALASIHQLNKILQCGVQTKKQEAVKRICSWEYASCIDLWVVFISANIRDHDLQPLFFTMVQLINGLANMFQGPRYFPLRIKCIQWLHNLSSSSGIFIPVSSFALDILEYSTVKEGGKPGNAVNFHSVLKLPKHCLKSQSFQEECLFSAIEHLCLHFSQWSYHISFPELATIPLIRVKRYHETSTMEGLRHVIKRFIDQVEHNVDFVQKKRDEVAFSPNDHQSVESFLQLEKSNSKSPFTQYYKSIIEKALLRTSRVSKKARPQHDVSKRTDLR